MEAPLDEHDELLEHMAEGFARCEIVFDGESPRDFVYLQVNRAFERLTGLRDVVGRRSSEVIPGLSTRHPDLLARYARVVRTGEPERFETYVEPLGEWFSITAYRPRPGQFVALFDVTTQRKRAAVEHDAFRLGAERAKDAIFVTAPDGTITYVNPAFEKLYGFTRAEAIGKTPRILKSGVQPPELYEGFWARLLAGEVFSGTLINATKSGERLLVEASVNPISDAGGALIGFLAIQRDVTEQRVAQEAQTFFRAVVDQLDDAIHIADAVTGRFVDVNAAGCAALGYTRDEYLAMHVWDVAPHVRATVFQGHIERVRVNGPMVWEGVHRRKDGSTFPVEVGVRYVQLDRGYMVAVARDISERKKAEAARARLEEQLRQAQKMETVGRLASGIAHDFNNVLSVILSYAEVAAEELSAADPLRRDLEEIQTASKRAADLTQQLLAFSRQRPAQTQRVDLGETIAGMDKMLRRLLGEDVELRTQCAASCWKIEADPGQLEQVVMNLAVNARDAMPDGGALTIETANVELDEEGARAHLGTRPGPYVLLTVRDTGHGMDAETRARIFDPFFTTKPVGKGTGLGLAIVFGVVQQSGGSIAVESEPDEGTTFRLYFPRADGAGRSQIIRRSSMPARRRGSETVLVVEDEPQLLTVVEGVLRRHGYEVLTAASPGDAVLASEQHPKAIDLLLTDVVMPGMNGRQLAARLAKRRPTMKVLYMSGHTGDALDHGALDEAPLLEKPVTPNALMRALRDVLDGG